MTSPPPPTLINNSYKPVIKPTEPAYYGPTEPGPTEPGPTARAIYEAVLSRPKRARELRLNIRQEQETTRKSAAGLTSEPNRGPSLSRPEERPPSRPNRGPSRSRPEERPPSRPTRGPSRSRPKERPTNQTYQRTKSIQTQEGPSSQTYQRTKSAN